MHTFEGKNFHGKILPVYYTKYNVLLALKLYYTTKKYIYIYIFITFKFTPYFKNFITYFI